MASIWLEEYVSMEKSHPSFQNIATLPPLLTLETSICCEILKYSQVYDLYRSIVWQERGRTHKDLNERKKIN